jgi:hypothetical protein
LSKNNFSLDSIWEFITCLKGAATPSPFEKGDRGGFSEPSVKSPQPPFVKGGLTEKEMKTRPDFLVSWHRLKFQVFTHPKWQF